MATIVFCEDDPLIRKLIQVAMRDEPHEFHIAEDGAEGLALIRRHLPDLIVTDISMVGMNGLELCDAVRADPALRHIPIVILSASVQRSEIEKSLLRGADGYLTKPFTLEQLRSQVRELTS
jgi:two-component system, OmpR family, alkaline phosphatase synthesis response regulator PhoP